MLAHGADPAEVEGLPSLASKPASRCQKAQAWEESSVPLLSWKLGWQSAQRETSSVKSEAVTFQPSGSKAGSGIGGGPRPKQEQTSVLKHRVERGPGGRQAGLATGHGTHARPAGAQDTRAEEAPRPLGPPEPQSTRAAEADSRRLGPLTPQ